MDMTVVMSRPEATVEPAAAHLDPEPKPVLVYIGLSCGQ